MKGERALHNYVHSLLLISPPPWKPESRPVSFRRSLEQELPSAPPSFPQCRDESVKGLPSPLGNACKIFLQAIPPSGGKWIE